MQKLISTAILCAAFAALSAQSPLYLAFDPSYMNQLEYRLDNATTSLLAYSLNKGDNDHYLFITGEALPSADVSLPRITAGRDLVINEDLFQAINSRARPAYLVGQTQNGYAVRPILSVSRVQRYGATYLLRAPGYALDFDTSKLVYRQNLARAGSAAAVYFTGVKRYGCRYLYSFRMESGAAGAMSVDFDFVPSLGIVNELTTLNGQQNQVRLYKVQNLFWEEYLAGLCGDWNSNKSSQPQPAQYNTYGDRNNKPNTSFKPIQPQSPQYNTYGDRPNEDNAWRNPSTYNVPSEYNTTSPISSRPANVQATYKVQRGETLASIARRFGYTTDYFRYMNNRNRELPNDDETPLRPGLELFASDTKGERIAFKDYKPAYEYYSYRATPPAAQPYNYDDSNNRAGTKPGVSSDPLKPAVNPNKPRQYTVQAGETFHSIARKLDVSVEKLATLNKMKKDDKLKAGYLLYVPPR